MRFKVKIYKRLGAISGSIIGVLCMIAAICLYSTELGAVLLMACVCIGVMIGNIAEKKSGR